MWFSNNSAICGLLVTIFLGQLQIGYAINGVAPTDPEQGELKTIIDGAVQTSLSVATIASFAIPPPAGVLLASAFTAIHGAYMIFKGISTGKVPNIQSSSMRESQELRELITLESKNIINTLIDLTAATLLEGTRTELEIFDSHCKKYLPFLLSQNNTGQLKKDILENLLNPTSQFRVDLRTFVLKYIKTQRTKIKLIHAKNAFFDYIVQKGQRLSKDNLDCHSQSENSRIVKVYLYMADVFATTYGMIIKAHVIRYTELKSKNPKEAKMYADQGKEIIKEFFNDIKALMAEAKWAIDQSWREIRSCDPSIPKKGENFERVNLFRRKFIGRPYNRKDFPECQERLESGPFGWVPPMFFGCVDLGPGAHDIYMNYTDAERPFHHMNEVYISFFQEEWIGKTYGKNEDAELLYRDRKNNDCLSKICFAYNSMEYYSRLVQATAGYVITGIRWRVTNNTLFVDIQEGKFINAMEVNEASVRWKITPEDHNYIKPIEHEAAKIVLDDILLPPESYLTGVQLSTDLGKIELLLTGMKTDNSSKKLDPLNERFASSNNLFDLVEWKIRNADDPEIAPPNSLNVVLRDRGRYFVRFRPTDLEKDFSRTTVPYLDIQEVVTNPPAPMNGVGIYYKAVEGYGGFVGLKLLSPDFSYMINQQDFEDFTKVFEFN